MAQRKKAGASFRLLMSMIRNGGVGNIPNMKSTVREDVDALADLLISCLSEAGDVRINGRNNRPAMTQWMKIFRAMSRLARRYLVW